MNNPEEKNVYGGEPTPLEKHEKKIIGYILNDGDIDFITEQNGKDWNSLTFTDEYNVYKKINENYDDVKGLEHKLLSEIKLPSDKKGLDAVFTEVSDKHSRRILTYMNGKKWEDWGNTSADDLKTFLANYPTPMDFEGVATSFLTMIRQHNGDAKSQEYNVAMDDFCKNVYGKRYEYYEAMKELDKEAKEQFAE